MLTTAHPWHLTRCAACRTFLISSAPQCPKCGKWRRSVRALSFVAPVLTVAAVAILLILATRALAKLDQRHEEERALLILMSQSQSR